jgi:RNA polymerase sigma factor (TIGR02999 family)
MQSPQPDITTLLRLAAEGQQEAREELFHLVQGELRRQAKARLRREQLAHNLQTTVLVNEAFVQLVGDQKIGWESRTQFFCFAAKVMRQTLVDEARHRAAGKRGAGMPPIPLERVADLTDRRGPDPLTLLAVHEALDKLAEQSPELVKVVELRYFGGWELKQIAQDVLGVPYPTVKKWWQRAKALLHRELSKGDEDA